MMCGKKLSDVFPDWKLGKGIFETLQNFDVPWKNENINLSLDFEYYGNNSGKKLISPLVESILIGSTLSENDKVILATVIFSICGVNWSKQWETLTLLYNPIENYSMTETMTDDVTVDSYGKNHTRNDNMSHIKTGTETENPDITETNTPDVTVETNNSVYGFNSDDSVDSDFHTTNSSGETTTVTQGTNTHTYNTNDSNTGTISEIDSGEDTHTRNYMLKRSGNIGTLTSQQMVQSQRDLWKWEFFYEVVFPDIDRILTLNIY